MKKFLALLLIAVLCAALLPAALGDEIAYTGTVTGGTLNMRSAPSASAKVVSSYKSGTEVEILENDGVWCKVKKGNKTGYMMAQYLKITANYPQIGWGQTEYTNQILNIRKSPDEESAVVYKCHSGVTLELIADAGDYYKVRAENVFGYVKKELITPVNGDFLPGLSMDKSGALSAASLKSAPREAGVPLTRSNTEGDFTYSLTYPDMDMAEADDSFAFFVQNTLELAQKDHEANHAGEKATLTMEYQTLQIDERYQSIFLLADYQVANFSPVQFTCALTIDRQDNSAVAGDDLIYDPDGRLMFALESAVTPLMTTPTDGYSGKPDETWWWEAIPTKTGMAFYLHAGVYLPLSLGTRMVELEYSQIAEQLNMESELVSAHIRKIDPSKPMIALTFDDGPSEQTEKILNTLQKYGGKATFCVQGINVGKYPDLIKRMVAEGHEIASHTWNHKKLTEISDSSVRSQLQRTSDAVREVTGGYEIKVLRPPYGSTNKRVRNICAEMDLVIAHWKVDTLDWSTRSTSKTYRAIIRGAENGAIVLCHDLYSSTAAAIEQAVPELIEKGYQLVTVSELLSFHKDGAQPGTVYAFLDPENIKEP